MSKFKKSENSGGTELQVGAGLLSPASQGADVVGDTIVNIDMDMIVPNEMNEFSMDELEELAELIIASGGIWQPLILKPDRNQDGTYTLTTGERRWRAAHIARDKGQYPAVLKNTVPCVFKDPKELDLPLSNESKELFSIMLTNQYRHKKESDQITEVRNWTRIFQELRDNGEKFIPEKLAVLAGRARYNEQGEYIPEVLTGQKTKELVSNHMKISEGKYQQINALDKSAGEALMNKLMRNEVSFSAAEKMLQMPEEEQEKFIEETKGKRIESDVVEKRIEEIEEKIVLTKLELSETLDDIKLKFSEDGKSFGSKEWKKYQSCLKQLEKILK